MSMNTATARKALPLRAPAKAGPKLVVLAPQQVVGRTPFVLLVGGLMLAGLLALLMLHTLAAQDAFRQTSLQQRLANLTDDEQRLEQQVQIDSAPAALRARAKALGMVPSVIAHYRRLPSGRTVAREVAASTVTTPVVTTTTATNRSSDTSKTSSTNTGSATTDAATATAKTASTKKHTHRGAAIR